MGIPDWIDTMNEMAPKMRRSIVHQRLAKNLPVYCFKSNIPSPMMPEMLGLTGIHCLWLDTEHLSTNSETMTVLVQAARCADTDAVVRVKNGEYGMAARMLDNGANGIMYPQVKAPEDAAKLVEYTRFAPIGRRGADYAIPASLYSLMSWDDFSSYQNEQVQLIIQIETPEAVECVDDIASVPGISLLFIGPGDLSITMGLPVDPEAPHIRNAMERTAQAAKKHNIPWGMPVFNTDHAARVLSMGGRFLAYGSDSSVLLRAVKKMREEIAEVADSYGGIS